MSKTETGWQFALRFGGQDGLHPARSHTIYRSDDMIGDGGCVMVSRLGTDARVEVPYGDLSRLSLREVRLDGVPVVRVRRTLDGTIVGEWIQPSTQASAAAPRDVAPPAAGEGERGATSPGSTDALAGALKLAGALFSRSSGTGLRTLGSFLSDVSQGLDQSSAQATTPSARDPEVPSQEAPDERDTVPTADVGPPATAAADRAMTPAPLPAIPRTRICSQCGHFRPYVRASDRFTEELAEGAGEEAVARGIDDLRSIERKGKGEEAKQLADLYRRGFDRWVTRPSFFSYCGVHEIDAREPTFFIAQVRNADRRCSPVRRRDGQRFNDAPTDFAPVDPSPHSCNTCVHRIRAAGPGEDARELREIVSSASYAEQLSTVVGQKGSGVSSLLSSYPEMKRKNAAAARAREMAQAFARRAMDSHTPIEPRYLDRCGYRSNSGLHRWRVCAIENANECCTDWTPR